MALILAIGLDLLWVLLVMAVLATTLLVVAHLLWLNA
jgi:hypothetical protein